MVSTFFLSHSTIVVEQDIFSEHIGKRNSKIKTLPLLSNEQLAVLCKLDRIADKLGLKVEGGRNIYFVEGGSVVARLYSPNLDTGYQAYLKGTFGRHHVLSNVSGINL